MGKSSLKMPNIVYIGKVFFFAFGQTVLPDRSFLIRQKLVKSAKIKKINATYLVIFKHCATVAISI